MRPLITVIAVLSLLAAITPGKALADDAGSDRAGLKDRMAAASAKAGSGIGRTCAMCHDVAPKNTPGKMGPTLWNATDRPIASVPNFNYSAALKALGSSGKTWTDEELNDFLYNPQAYAHGTKMAYTGIKNPQDRANVIAWLHKLNDQTAAAARKHGPDNVFKSRAR